MNVYSSDFETTTDKKDCRVWAWGSCLVDDPYNSFEYGNTLDGFIERFKNENSQHWFHNAGFDTEFILYWLFTHGYSWSDKKKRKGFTTVISQTGVFYSLKIWFQTGKTMTIYDSMKKFPFSVDKIARDFKLGIKKLKGSIDYDEFREIGHTLTEKEIAYLKNDVIIVALALQGKFNAGLVKMTRASDALNDYKEIIGKKTFEQWFPILDLELDKDIRQSYKGGFVWVNPRFQDKKIERGIVYDVNSLYPSRMLLETLPFGQPVAYTGEYQYDKDYPLFIQYLRCRFRLKKNHIPTIQLKNNFAFRNCATEYLTSSVNSAGQDEQVAMVLTSVDLQLFYDHYDIFDLELVRGLKFRSSNNLFTDYINKWGQAKVNAKTPSEKQNAKDMLNCLYGKFGKNPDTTGKIPYLKEDESVGYCLPWHYDLNENGEQVKVTDQELSDPIYIPLASFITAYARNVTIRTAQKLYDRIIYCDTDSIHLVGDQIPDIDIHESRLGAWKHESTFEKARFIRAKTYMEIIKIDEAEAEKLRKNDQGAFVYKHQGQYYMKNIKCAGMPDNIKKTVSFKKFKVGFTSGEKLIPCHVKGGIVLEKHPFVIRP